MTTAPNGRTNDERTGDLDHEEYDEANDPLALLARSLDQAHAQVAAVRPGDRDRPTPCRSWTVGALVDHLMNDLAHFTERARGREPDYGRADLAAGPNAAGEFRAGAYELVTAWTESGFDDDAARFTLGQQTSEFAVHSWDLAAALGQGSHDLDADLAERSLAWGRTALRPEFRGDESEGKAFGPEVTVPDDAPAPDRLAAFFGRTPG